MTYRTVLYHTMSCYVSCSISWSHIASTYRLLRHKPSSCEIFSLLSLNNAMQNMSSDYFSMIYHVHFNKNILENIEKSSFLLLNIDLFASIFYFLYIGYVLILVEQIRHLNSSLISVFCVLCMFFHGDVICSVFLTYLIMLLSFVPFYFCCILGC